jgi:hypothetical protein
MQLTHPTAGPGNTPATLALPEDLIWVNEFGWQQIEQRAEYTTTGALVLDTWPAKQAGRPMELQGGVDYAWCLRSTLSTLQAWAAQPGQTFTLTRAAVAHTVVFDHASQAIAAAPVVPYSDPEPADHYTLTLRFLIL